MREIGLHLRFIFPLNKYSRKCLFIHCTCYLLLNFNGMNKQTGSFYYSKMSTRESRQITSLQITFRQLVTVTIVNYVLWPKSREIKKYQNEESLFSFGIGFAHVGHRLHQYFICQVYGQTKIREHSGQTSAL